MKALSLSTLIAVSYLALGIPVTTAVTTPQTDVISTDQKAGIPKQDPQLITGKLPNGLTYFIRPNAEPKGRFSIRLRVNTGSLNETDDIQGISHFLEHMVFNGSRHFKRGEMIPAMQQEGLGLGGDANAYTSFNETVYTMDVPSLKDSTVNLAFTIMRDFADGALLEADAIEKERGIITSEYKVRDSAGYRVMKEVFAIMLDGTQIPHRYPIGTLDMIQNAPREKFVQYYTTHYVPSQMQLVVAGDITPEQAKAWIEKYFGSMQKDNYNFELSRGTLKTNKELTAHWITNPEATGTEVSLNIVRPFEQKPDTIAQRNKDIPLNVAYSMLNRRLAQMTKHADCPFIKADIGRMDLLRTAQIDALEANTDHANYRQALTVLEQELRRAIEFGFTQTELDEARNSLVAAAENAINAWPTVKSEELASAIVNTAAEDKVFTTPQEDWTNAQAVVAALTPEQCQAALKAAWTSAVPRILVTSNQDNPQGTADVLATYKTAQETKLEPYKSEQRKAFAYDFGKAGKVVAKNYVQDLNLTQLTLSNGVKVNLKPTEFDKDSINVTMMVDGGKLTRPAKASGLDIVAEAVMNGGGLKDHSIDDLAAVLAGKQVGSDFGVAERSFMLSGSTNKEDLATQLELQTAQLLYPGYRADGLTVLRRSLPMLYKKLAHDTKGVMQQKFPGILYKNNPRFNFPTQEQLASYQVKDVQDWLAEPLKNNYLEVTLTGDFDPQAVIPLLERTVGALPARASQPATGDPALRKPDMIEFDFAQKIPYDSTIDKTVVCLFWKLPDTQDKKLTRRLTLLKEIFAERVFKGIRENMGETYSPSTSAHISETYPDTGYIITRSPGVVRNMEPVTKAILAIADQLGKGDVTQEELERARNPLLNTMERAQRDNGYWSGLLKDAQSYPGRLDQQRESIPDVKAITLQEINDLAKQVFGSGKHLNLNVVPEHPESQNPPAADKQAAPAQPAAAHTAAFSIYAKVAKPAKKSAKKKDAAAKDTKKQTDSSDYVILISEETMAQPEWKKVAKRLHDKHNATAIVFKDTVFSKLEALQKAAPKYLALVAQPSEIDRTLINDLHRISRNIDSDPYGDCIWGIITGYDPKDAMRIVDQKAPLTITRASGTTNVDPSRFGKSMLITDWQPFQYLEQEGGQKDVQPAFYAEGVKEQEANNPATLGVAPKLTEYWQKNAPQLMVTASHATQFNLEMPFGKGCLISGNNGFYALSKKQFQEFGSFLRGVLFNGKEEDLLAFLQRTGVQPIQTKPVPAVWLAAGNCLIGDAMKSKNSMVITALSRYGFNQMVGYTVPSWYGKGGWGTLSLFFGNHDNSSLAQAWYLNNQFILDETMQRFPKLMSVNFNSSDINGIQNDPNFIKGMQQAGYGMGKEQLGLIHDRDTVAFYGDPAWVAKLDESKSKSPWHVDFTNPVDASQGITVTANRDNKGRLGIWFPNKIASQSATVTVGNTVTPLQDIGLLTNDFLLIRDLNLGAGQKAVIEFK